MNHKHVLYPLLWTELWKTGVTLLARIRLATASGLIAAAIGLGLVYGFLRAFIAVIAGAAIVWVGGRYLQSILTAPAEPEVADVERYDLHYVCTMCGLELRVEKAARDKPPTHCMERMVLVRGDEGNGRAASR